MSEPSAWVRARGPLLLFLVALVGWSVLWMFPALRTVFFLGFLGVVLATVLEVPIRLLSRVMPRPLAMLVVVLALLGVAAGTVAGVLPVLGEQVSELLRRVPAALDRIERWWRSLSTNGIGSELLGDPEELLGALRRQAGRLLVGVVPAALGLVSILGYAVLTVALALFLAYDPGQYFRGLLLLVPREREPAVREVSMAVVMALRGWMLGTLGAMSLIGVLTGLGLFLLGIDIWFALAVLAFFGEFIPFLGPVLTAIPGVIAGLADSPSKAVWVIVVYVVVQQVESNLIQPLIMRWAVKIRPALLLLWQLAFITGFGLLGLLVSSPLLAAVQAGILRGYVGRVLGKEPSLPPPPSEQPAEEPSD